MNKQHTLRVQVHGESANATRIDLTSGKFELIIDEPERMGGADAGPSPVQVLLMALAGCLNVTGHVVAREREIALHGMNLTIAGELNPAVFMGATTEGRAGFQQIDVIITADAPDATEEELHAWLAETERRCPVTDNLRAATDIAIQVNQARDAKIAP